MDNLSTKITDEISWPTTEAALTADEEGTLVLIVVIVGIIAAIIFLFSMGVFIDCRTQHSMDRNTISSTGKRKRLRLKMPPLGRAQRHHQRGLRREDSKCLAADMCPNGSSVQPAAELGVAVV